MPSLRKYDPALVDVPRMLAELGIDAKKEGNAWIAKCPSGRHEDKKPSFRVVDEPGSKKHGLGYCFSCKFGGSPVDVVRAVYGFAGSAEAVRWLIEKAVGPATNIETMSVRISSTTRLEFRLPPEAMFLSTEDWADTPRSYLHGRGVSDAQISMWGLGYAVDGRLRGRIVIPARSADGRPANYTGRTFSKQLLRYLSAREEENPDHDAIFGEHLWPRIDARRTSRVVVVEGALNAIACARALPGTPVAALFGSKVSIGHLLKLSAFGCALIATDPDPAGDAAAERLWGSLVRHVSRVSRVRLPVGEDAASVSPEVLKEHFDRAELD